MDDESARLMAEYMDGNSDAATQIYNKYVSRLIALVRNKISPKLSPRFDAEDVVQSAYRSFFRKAKDEKIVLTRSGDLWRVGFAYTTPLYDVPALALVSQGHYDLLTGTYYLGGISEPYYGLKTDVEQKPARYFTAQGLSKSGIR